MHKLSCIFTRINQDYFIAAISAQLQVHQFYKVLPFNVH